MKELALESSYETLRAAVWDNANPKGTIQIAHGLVEYHGRYDDLANFFNKNGYIVFCNDHLGHGLHVKNGSKKGIFLKRMGMKT